MAKDALAGQEDSVDKSYELTATATLASDYMFRGVTQTQDDPAVHAAFDFTHSSGFFAGVWGSNVDFQDGGPSDDEADLEVDVYVGYGTDFSEDWSGDATIIRYILPGTSNDSDLDWNELLVGLHYKEYVSFLVGYSDEVFNIDDRGIYYSVSGNWPVAENMRLTASVGYYDLDDALNDSYTDWSLGSELDIGMFTLRLAYVDTNSAANDLFGADQVDGRLVASITASFSQ